jgi:hypothetical protein
MEVHDDIHYKDSKSVTNWEYLGVCPCRMWHNDKLYVSEGYIGIHQLSAHAFGTSEWVESWAYRTWPADLQVGYRSIIPRPKPRIKIF